MIEEIGSKDWVSRVVFEKIQIFNGTAVISLLQLAPETYNFFNDIILISDGQIVYQGPVNKCLKFLNQWALNVLRGKGW